MSAISCRRADPADLSGIREVALTVLPEAADLESWLAQPTSELWVAAQVSTVVGFLAAQRIDVELEILWLAVAASSQRTGVGSRLLAKASEEARSCVLEVRSNNLDAKRFYESQGFRESGTRNGYYPSGEDAILFNRGRSAVPEG